MDRGSDARGPRTSNYRDANNEAGPIYNDNAFNPSYNASSSSLDNPTTTSYLIHDAIGGSDASDEGCGDEATETEVSSEMVFM